MFFVVGFTVCTGMNQAFDGSKETKTDNVFILF